MVYIIQIIHITLHLMCIQQAYSQWSEFDNVHNCKNDNNEKGRCKLITECKTVASIGSSFNICGYYKNYKNERIEVVCCPDINKYIKPILGNYYPGMTVSEQKCLDYDLERERQKLLSKELISPHCEHRTKICQLPRFAAGGFNAEKDEFPHMVALGWEKVEGMEYNWQCGGSLISKDYILTAAHCLYDPSPQYLSPKPSVVRLGDEKQIIIKIIESINHLEYKPPMKYNDIGLLKLAETIGFTKAIWPACLHVNMELPVNVIGTGWGELSTGGDRPERLQKVYLETLDNDTCQDYYPKSRILSKGILESQFCAGSKFGGRDTCQGDSGGPLQIKSDRYKDTFEIVGIVSIGYECGSEYGGVYTRVKHYNDWIQKIVWPEDKNI